MRYRAPAIAAVLCVTVAITTSQANAVAAPAAVAAGPALVAIDPPTIADEAPMVHIRELQKIADANGGNRAHGRAGFKASVDYVKRTLDAAGFQTTLHPFTHAGAQGWNVIAEWPHGDANNVVMLGAHLDSVTAGPGLNDNGTGASALLENALTVAKSNLRPDKRMRFGWWGAEEVGLIGSKAYVSSLSAAEKKKIGAYLNFDMVGTKKVTKWGIYSDGDAGLASQLDAWFKARNIPTISINLNSRSDHAAFRAAGIKASGVISEDSLSRLDPCYHQACDNAANVLPKAEGIATNMIASIFWQLAGAKTAVAPVRS
ncbi:M28 family peptidase [Pilimelia columellifera]|uniref:M28 family metallopeptidase n=1 Tax=Pilimelia columellifera subsp. columellifera TaxID=706583 RepID=A0ABP6AXM6_9ACTN